MVGYLYSKCFLARFMLKWFHFIWRWVCVCSRTRTKLCYPSFHVKRQSTNNETLCFTRLGSGVWLRAQISLQCQNMLDLHLLDVAVVTIHTNTHTHISKQYCHALTRLDSERFSASRPFPFSLNDQQSILINSMLINSSQNNMWSVKDM